MDIKQIRAALAGKKTFLLAVATIIGIVAAWSTGEMPSQEAIQGIITALLAITLRDGINTAVKQ